jgi:hypothetical protein
MNDLVYTLKEEHKSHLDEMKHFYDDYIGKIREEYTKSQTQQVPP